MFYCPKASRSERNRGCEGMEPKANRIHAPRESESESEKYNPSTNHHPTVKPQALMRWLCRLITPKDGTVLDPFLGSGSTGVAALAEGFAFIGIEQSEEYLEIARRRIEAAQAECPLFAT